VKSEGENERGQSRRECRGGVREVEARGQLWKGRIWGVQVRGVDADGAELEG
jgi:hypothetical protein